MDGILALVWATAMVIAVLGLIRPRWVRLPSRVFAASLFFFSFVPLAAAVEFYPLANAEPAEGITIGFVVLWAIASGAGWAISRKDRYARPTEPGDARAANGGEASTPLARDGSFYLAENRKRVGEAVQANARRQRESAAAKRSDKAARARYGAANVERPGLGTALCSAPPGHRISFSYVDANGTRTDRTISRWTEYPRHLSGWCEDQLDDRLFRKDRVSCWNAGADVLKRPGLAQGERSDPVKLEIAVQNLRVTPALPARRKASKPATVESASAEPSRDHASGGAGFISYSDSKGDLSERRIVVKKIEGYGKAETIAAWCCERNSNRRFLVSGIRELICGATGEVLDPQSHFDQLAREGAVGSIDKSLADLMTILVFLARCDGDFHVAEMETLDRALLEHAMAFGGDPKAIRAACKKARGLAPDGKDFLAALDRVERHPRRRELAEMILGTAEELIEADGHIATDEERWYDAVMAKLDDMAELEAA